MQMELNKKQQKSPMDRQESFAQIKINQIKLMKPASLKCHVQQKHVSDRTIDPMTGKDG